MQGHIQRGFQPAKTYFFKIIIEVGDGNKGIYVLWHLTVCSHSGLKLKIEEFIKIAREYFKAHFQASSL